MRPKALFLPTASPLKLCPYAFAYRSFHFRGDAVANSSRAYTGAAHPPPLAAGPPQGRARPGRRQAGEAKGARSGGSDAKRNAAQRRPRRRQPALAVMPGSARSAPAGPAALPEPPQSHRPRPCLPGRHLGTAGTPRARIGRGGAANQRSRRSPWQRGGVGCPRAGRGGAWLVARLAAL